MQAMLDDVRPDDGDLEGLADQRLGVVPGEASAAAAAATRPHLDDLVGLELDAVVPPMHGLAASPPSRRLARRGRLEVRGSLDGGRDEFDELCSSLASNSAIRASNTATTTATTAWASGGIASHVPCGMTSGRVMPRRCSISRLRVNHRAVNGYLRGSDKIYWRPVIRRATACSR